jgi:hypothetical protein
MEGRVVKLVISQSSGGVCWNVRVKSVKHYNPIRTCITINVSRETGHNFARQEASLNAVNTAEERTTSMQERDTRTLVSRDTPVLKPSRGLPSRIFLGNVLHVATVRT